LGLITDEEYSQAQRSARKGESVLVKLDYEDVCGAQIYLLPACDSYEQGADGVFTSISGDDDKILEKLDSAVRLKLVGIVHMNDDVIAATVNGSLGYISPLTDYLISHTQDSAVVKAQLDKPEIDVLTGQKFMSGTLAQAMGMSGSCEDNLKKFGYVSADEPTEVNLYVDTFEDKDMVTQCIERYNESCAPEDCITYTDYVGLLLSSVTDIVNSVSYVLIAFVAVSLVVSSIMIGIITYISVLERTREIGILRALGASKRNVSGVFNAETFIVGALSGILGVVITNLLLIPANAVIHAVTETDGINAALPIGDAIILIVLSTLLTMLGGIIPSKKAARQDPVKALRAE